MRAEWQSVSRGTSAVRIHSNMFPSTLSGRPHQRRQRGKTQTTTVQVQQTRLKCESFSFAPSVRAALSKTQSEPQTVTAHQLTGFTAHPQKRRRSRDTERSGQEEDEKEKSHLLTERLKNYGHSDLFQTSGIACNKTYLE